MGIRARPAASLYLVERRFGWSEVVGGVRFRPECSGLRFARDLCAQRGELSLEAVVAALEVVDPRHPRFAFRGQRRDDERRDGANVAAPHRRSPEPRGAAYTQRHPPTHDVRPQIAQGARMLHAVLEDPLINDGYALRLREQRGHRRLQVGWEAGVGRRLHIDGFQRRGRLGRAHRE